MNTEYETAWAASDNADKPKANNDAAQGTIQTLRDRLQEIESELASL